MNQLDSEKVYIQSSQQHNDYVSEQYNIYSSSYTGSISIEKNIVKSKFISIPINEDIKYLNIYSDTLNLSNYNDGIVINTKNNNEVDIKQNDNDYILIDTKYIDNIKRYDISLNIDKLNSNYSTIKKIKVNNEYVTELNGEVNINYEQYDPKIESTNKTINVSKDNQSNTFDLGLKQLQVNAIDIRPSINGSLLNLVDSDDIKPVIIDNLTNQVKFNINPNSKISKIIFNGNEYTPSNGVITINNSGESKSYYGSYTITDQNEVININTNGFAYNNYTNTLGTKPSSINSNDIVQVFVNGILLNFDKYTIDYGTNKILFNNYSFQINSTISWVVIKN